MAINETRPVALRIFIFRLRKAEQGQDRRAGKVLVDMLLDLGTDESEYKETINVMFNPIKDFNSTVSPIDTSVLGNSAAILPVVRSLPCLSHIHMSP
ncbi:hypothetical protein J6590_009418 [Homalodisca vitripennis]|nr:hypothetical protein J6590_009418 [Homalodisca vitripennis]